MGKKVYVLMVNQMPMYDDHLGFGGVYEKESDAFHDGVAWLRERAGVKELYEQYKEDCYCDGVNAETFEEYIGNTEDLMKVIETDLQDKRTVPT